MRLSKINEGFGFNQPDIALNRDTLLAKLHEKPSRQNMPNPFEAYLEGIPITFSSTDRPEDILKIEPAQEAISLDRVAEEWQLPEFDGTIFIGFKTVQSDSGYGHEVIDKLIRPLDAVMNDPVLNRYFRYEDLQNAARRFNRFIQADLPNRNHMLKSYEFNQQEAERAEELAKKINDAMGVMSYVYNKLFSGALIHNVGVAQIKKKILTDVVKPLTQKMSYEFARRLKHPKNESDVENRKTFIKLAVEQFKKMPQSSDYDYIVYPDSTSNNGEVIFNHELAVAIQGAIGSKGKIVTLSKLSKERATVDRESLVHRGLEQAHGNREAAGYARYSAKDQNAPPYFKTPEEWAENFADTEVRKIGVAMGKGKKKDPPKVKYIPHDKRRYAQFFDTDKLQSEVQTTGSDAILVIDDNLVGAGTMERVYVILKSLNPPPAVIDVYVPLKIQL